MQASVRWLYSRIDGHEPALVFEGSKHAHCVVLDYPIRVFQCDVRTVKEMRPVEHVPGKPYSTEYMARDLASRAKSHGITNAAKSMIDAILAGGPIEAEPDATEDATLDARQSPPPKRKTVAEVKEEFDSTAPKPEPKPAKRRKPRKVELDDGSTLLIHDTKKEAEETASRLTPKGGTLVAKISAEVGIEPKDARKKLRAAGLSAPYDDEAKIRAVLKPKEKSK